MFEIRIKKESMAWIAKSAALICVISLVFQAAGFNILYSFEPSYVRAAIDGGFCAVDIDVALVMDSSGSMEEGETQSRCDWWEIQWVPAENTNKWVFNTDYGVTEQWCAAKNLPPPRSSVYTPAVLSKIEAAQNAAKSFLDNLSSGDQSAVVSFSTTAILQKLLSNDHIAGKTAIDSLAPAGSTNIGDAIAVGALELGSERANPQATKTIILLTDGKANKPNGYGYGEYPADVAYAKQKAQEAADLGYKIFTIGLGSSSEINQTMLQDIADIGNARYYHSPDGNSLAGIYGEISQEICQYGSISGYKYNDSNNDGEIQDEEVLAGWEIVLSGNASSTQSTDENGFYTFAGLLAGSYTVAEGDNADKEPYVQTYPESGFYNVNLAKGENADGIDFANYLPVCGNAILDEQEGEQCDDGNTTDGDGCSAVCQIEEEPEEEPDEEEQPPAPEPVYGSISGHKYQDLDGMASTTNDWIGIPDWIINLFNSTATSTPTAATTTDSQGYFEFDSLLPDNYSLTENLPAGWTQLYAPTSTISILEGTVSENNNFVNATSSEEVEEEEATSTIDIIINEIMQNPDAVPDSRGEWFELYNNSSSSVDLQGCVIRDDGADSHIIANPLVVSAGGYAVLAKNGNFFQNGGITVDYVYSGIILTNSADEIIIECNGSEIDRVEYDDGVSFPDPEGASMISAGFNLDNNNGANWCVSSSLMGNGDLGTPGALNDSCASEEPPIYLPICGNSITDASQGEQCDDGNTTDGDGCSAVCQIEEEPEEEPDEEEQPPAPEPVYGSISGHKYQDLDGMASTTNDWIGIPDWIINLFNSTATSTPTAATTTDSQGYFEFDSLLPDNYSLTENLPAGWTQLYAPTSTISILEGTVSENNNFVNATSSEEAAGEEATTTDNEVEQPAGDSGNSSNGSGGSSGGGGGGGGSWVQIHNIRDENNLFVDQASAVVSWVTSFFSTSRVVYDTISGVFNPNNPPNYGYAYSTPEYDTPANTNGVTYHQVTINDLIPGTTYYYRVISSASPDIIGGEKSFATLAAATSLNIINENAAEPPAAFIAPIGGQQESIGQSGTKLPSYGIPLTISAPEKEAGTLSGEETLSANEEESIGVSDAISEKELTKTTKDDSGASNDKKGVALVMFGFPMPSWLIIALLIIAVIFLAVFVIVRRRSSDDK